MKHNILLDGAAGTTLWALAEAAGVAKVPTWRYNIEHPEFVRELHRQYIAAGSRMIQTNTFDANRLSVERASDYTVTEVVTAAVRLAKEAVAGTDVKVYLSAGPLAVLMEPYGKVTRAQVREIYDEMVSAAVRAGVDAVLLETFMDVRMLAEAAQVAKGYGVPVFCSMTFAKRHRTMMGDSVQKIVETLTPLGVDAVGMNCSAGPVEALEIIREFRTATELPLFYKPNAGMGESYSAAQFAAEVAPALPLVTYVGGCCGCDASYIREIGKLL